MNNEINEALSKVVIAWNLFVQDCGGWFWFCGRIIWNAIILFYIISFFQVMFVLIFEYYGLIIDEKFTEIIKVLMFSIGLIYMAFIMTSKLKIKYEK